ncbi:MAG: acyl carrier protein [Firmicutes bacterium]|nr:acyl carrier protein [Bacillota bacterium]
MPEEERLRELFMEYLELDESLLLPEMSFDELAVDSLTLLELLTAIENEFDLELDDEAFGACNDLGEMSDMILAKIRG